MADKAGRSSRLKLFDYIAYRAYLSRKQAGDPFPLVGAAIMWSFYVAAPLIPVMTALSRSDLPWVPEVIRDHGAVASMVLTMPIFAIGYWKYLDPGVMSGLQRLFDSESPAQRRNREVFRWAWPVAVLILPLAVNWIVRSNQTL